MVNYFKICKKSESVDNEKISKPLRSSFKYNYNIIYIKKRILCTHEQTDKNIKVNNPLQGKTVMKNKLYF